MDKTKLKNLLDELYLQYQKKHSSKDPIWILHTLNEPRDIEIMGFIISAYSYGQVDQINKFTHTLYERIGNKPYEFTSNFNKQRDRKYLKGLYHRFNTEADLVKLFVSLHEVLKKYGSLEILFISGYDKNHENIIPALRVFTSVIRDSAGKGHRAGKYFDYLVPNPAHNSTCKRLNLYLRWMVRKDEIDLGIWKNVSRSKLIMPVDIHVARVSRHLKLVKRRTVDIKFAVELTETLKQFDKDDPVKYDFSLCHIGIDKKMDKLIL